MKDNEYNDNMYRHSRIAGAEVDTTEPLKETKQKTDTKNEGSGRKRKEVGYKSENRSDDDHVTSQEEGGKGESGFVEIPGDYFFGCMEDRISKQYI